MGVITFILELAGQTTTQNRQWLTTDLLREEEELIKTESVALVIIRVKAIRETILPTVGV